MKCNVGKTDRVIRIFAALVILGTGVFFRQWWGILGFIPLLTAVMAWCPLYTLAGLSTCRTDERLPRDTSTPTHDSPKPLRINR
jgi:hypothetical protein